MSNVKLKVIALSLALMLLQIITMSRFLYTRLTYQGYLRQWLKYKPGKLLSIDTKKYGLHALICFSGPDMGYLWQTVLLPIVVNMKMSVYTVSTWLKYAKLSRVYLLKTDISY